MVNDYELESSSISEYGRSNFSVSTMCYNYLKIYDQMTDNTSSQRILLIDVNCKNSSTGKIVYDLYRKIIADGRKAAICYGRGEKIFEDNIYKFGLDWETYLHAGLSRITGYNGCFSALSTLRLIKYLKKFKPDIIHIHELHAYFVNIKPILNYIKKNNIPVVWTFHCEYMYTGKCGHAEECVNFMYNCGNCPKIREYPKSLLFDKTSQMLSEKKNLLKDLDFQIITPSKWLADRVKLSYLKDKDIRVVHNGVDTDIFYPRNEIDVKRKYNIDKNAIMIIAVGNDILSDNKGGKYLLELSSSGEFENVDFVLVGVRKSDINELRHKYNSHDKDSQLIIESKSSRTKVHLIPLINNQIELACIYSAADLLLLTSKKETYSLPCAEALCCGTKVVGFECGAPETIFGGKYAKFVTYGDLEALKKEIKTSIDINNNL